MSTSPAPTPLSRRRFLQAGATTAAAATLLAACGGSSGDGGTGGATATTTTAPKATDRDQGILRTATSVELLLIQVYEQAAASGVLSEGGKATADLFAAQHKAHAEALQQETLKAGGTPVTAPNAALSQAVSGRLAFQNEGQAMALAYELEQTALATYVAAVGRFQTVELNEVALGIAGTDARHVAVLGAITGQPQVPTSGFAGTAGAVTTS